MRHLLHELDLEKHHIVLIQEPWINTHTAEATTCTDPRYYLCILLAERPRTAIYVSKAINLDTWRLIPCPELITTGDCVTVCLDTPQGELFIYNIYNPPPSSLLSRDLQTLRHIETLLGHTNGLHFLAGDFNLHHPQWGSDFQPAHHYLASHLIEHTAAAEMKLITPKGLTTWARALSSSTIDLAFLSEALTESITSCKVNDKLICGSDHMPIQTILDIPVQAAVSPKPRPQ